MVMILITFISVAMITLVSPYITWQFYQRHLQRKADKGNLTKDEWKVYKGPSIF